MTATIDTAAWAVLLLLFELEAFVLDDAKIKGALKCNGAYLSIWQVAELEDLLASKLSRHFLARI